MSKMSPTEINTKGGTAVTGDVNIVDGDFIGRDKNIYIVGEVAYDVRGLPNPYLGLRSFTYADRTVYAGRDNEIRETLEKLTSPSQQQTLLFVTGASGCGKSSFAQAGMLPALETYYNQRHLFVSYSVFRPSVRPMAMLKDALLQLSFETLIPPSSVPANQVSLLVIDQFEEVFTQSDRPERTAFFQWLTDLPSFEQLRIHVLATIRSDYLNELAEVSSLWVYAKDAIVLRAMGTDALKATIQRPLQVRYPNGEKRFEPDLVDRLATDASSDPTFLPLLQVTLEEIWRKGRLALAEYHNLTDALKQRADQVVEFEDYNSSTPQIRRSRAGQITMLNILLDLIKVSLDDNSQRDVRISRMVEALGNAEGGAFTTAERRKLINDLVTARLLSVVNESGVEIANIIHEALIHNWERLQKAIAERRQELQQRTRFEQSLQEWLAHEHSADYLLQGVHLAEARRLAESGDVGLRSSDEAKELLQCSLERAESEQRAKLAQAEARVKAERQTVIRTRLLLFVALVLSAVLGAPVIYRAFLRWNAINLAQLQSISESNVFLGHKPSNLDLADNYLPLREYHISAFQIEKYEVTNQRYNLCIKANACSPPNAPEAEYALAERSKFPVVNVTALQAAQFCEWVGRQLPTDLEWERAARYIDQRLWPWAHEHGRVEEINHLANFQTGSEYGQLMPVGSFPQGASVEGVEDLAGNVWEWTRSPFDTSLSNSTLNNSISIENIARTVSARGGGADVPADYIENLISSRAATGATKSNGYIGFRCIK